MIHELYDNAVTLGPWIVDPPPTPPPAVMVPATGFTVSLMVPATYSEFCRARDGYDQTPSKSSRLWFSILYYTHVFGNGGGGPAACVRMCASHRLIRTRARVAAVAVAARLLVQEWKGPWP